MKTFTCNNCTNTFSTKQSLDYHLHKKRIPCTLECRMCDFKTISKLQFKKHLEENHETKTKKKQTKKKQEENEMKQVEEEVKTQQPPEGLTGKKELTEDDYEILRSINELSPIEIEARLIELALREMYKHCDDVQIIFKIVNENGVDVIDEIIIDTVTHVVQTTVTEQTVNLAEI